ncbi:MAG: DNA cytosine methyltransferase, partial [Promethearchaeota archaeon]
MQNEKRKEIKYFSMFTGVGGFELGFENSGNKSNNETNPFNCVGVSEIDKYSNQVLRYRFPKIKNYGNA